MKCKILIDNTPFGQYCAEWGLAVYIEYNGKKLLLDTGASPLFADNAEKMGVDLSEIDFGILSHAHYDHSLGMDAFFRVNAKADVLHKLIAFVVQLDCERHTTNHASLSLAEHPPYLAVPFGRH